jgi:hypothetical protein
LKFCLFDLQGGLAIAFIQSGLLFNTLEKLTFSRNNKYFEVLLFDLQGGLAIAFIRSGLLSNTLEELTFSRNNKYLKFAFLIFRVAG